MDPFFEVNIPNLNRFFMRLFVLTLHLGLSAVLWSQTEVSGLVSGNWTTANSPYLVTNDAVIAEDTTLRIEAGVTVMFRDADDDLFVQGTLIAAGTSGSPIRFTTNEPNPGPGQWGQINFSDSSNDGDTQMVQCIVEYGGGFRTQQIEIVSSSPTLRNLTVRSGRANGIGIVGGNPILTDISFIENADYAMTVDVHSFPTLSGSQAQDNGDNSIGRHGGTLSKSGTWVQDAIPYTILNDIVVPSENHLTIEQGTTIQFRDADDDLFVEGILTATGTENAPILFTSDEKDRGPGQWGAIILRASDGSSESLLKHCIVEAGGGFRTEQIDISDTSTHLDQVLVRLGRAHGIRITNSNPIIESCTFDDNAQYAIIADVFSYPQVSDSKALRNGHDAIGRSGGTTTHSGTWVKDTIPYTITNDIIVKEGTTLTIDAGTTIQFQDGDDDLVFEGRLVAIGQESARIVFTSNEKDKAPGQWGAVFIRNQQDFEASLINWCVFEFGGGFRNEILSIDRASPMIENSIFRSSRQHGITLSASSPSISTSQFSSNLSYAMSMNVHSFPILNTNSATDNGSDSFGISGGTLSESGTWNADSVPFTIRNDIVIANVAEVTVKPGSTIQFADPDDDLIIEGTLVAQGTSSLPIHFTSDTSEKAPGQWGYIGVRESANDAKTIFEYCIIEYGGGFRNENLRLEKTSPRIIASQVNHGRARGLSLVDSHSRIAQSQFSHNASYAIVMDTESSPTFTDINATENGANAIGILGGTVEDTNTWHHSPIPYTILNDITVAPDFKLSIEPGSVIQFQDADDDLQIQGTLIAEGTHAQPIRFTSDDENKAPGQWGSVIFQNESNDADSRLHFVQLEYGGGFRTGLLELRSASPSLASILLQHARADGLLAKDSQSAIRDSRFINNNRDGIRTESGSTISVSQSIFEGNQGAGFQNQDTAVIIEATNNYWGSTSGPIDTRNDDQLEQTNPDGQGDAVSEYVRWRPFLEAPPTDVQPQRPMISASAIRVDFGNVEVGQASSRIVEISNQGEAELTIESADLSPSAYGVEFSTPSSLAPNEAIDISIRFQPGTTGSLNGSLTFNSNDPTQPTLTLSLTGTGITTTEPPPTEPSDPGESRRITFDHGNEFTPVWHPLDDRIAFATDRTPGDFNDLGMVNADATNERIIATGPQSPFGIAPFGISWMGPSDLLATTETVTFHEYLTFDTSLAPATRSIADGNDSAFNRLLLIDGGGGGELFTASRDGSTALWRFSSQGGRGQMTLRTAPLASLAGQSARAIGTIQISESLPSNSPRHIAGAGLFSDGSQFVVSLRRGSGYDLFLYSTSQAFDPIRLTTTGESGIQHTTPVVSPDNQMVAFVFHDLANSDHTEIYTLDLENRTLRNLTQTPLLNETQPSWSPDGTQLVYQRFDTKASGALTEGEPENWNLHVQTLDPTDPSDPTDPNGPPVPAAMITVSPQSIDFGQVLINGSTSREIIISNTGIIDLTINDANAIAPFEGLLPSFPLVIAPGASATATLIFRPTAPGEFTSTQTFGSNATNTPQLTIPLTGTAIELVVPFPVIDSIEPESGQPGSTVTLRGSGFSLTPARNIIRLGGQSIQATQTGASELVFVIPEGTRSGTLPIQVEVDGRQSNVILFSVESPIILVQPELFIEKTSNDSIAISWFDPLEQFTLQSRDRLTLDSPWKDWIGAITLENEIRQTLSPLGGAQFFRLVEPSESPNPNASTASLPISNLPLDWEPDYPVLGSVKGNISPQTGLELTMPNGGTVSAPINSVTENTPFLITELDFTEFSQVSRRVFQVDTSGTPFLQPIRLQLPAPEKAEGDSNEFVVYRNAPEEPITELPHTYDSANNLISFESDRFSTLIIERKQEASGPPVSQRILDVPFYPQGNSYWCWAASSQMIFKYYGKDIEAWEVARYFEMPPDDGPTLLRLGIGSYDRLFGSFGLEIDDISGWASLDHFRTYLTKQIDRGHPLMVLVQNAIHAIVVVGYDASGVYVHDPSGFSILNAKGVNTAAELFPNLGRSHFTWDQFKSALFGRKKLGIEFNVYLPVWALRIKNEPAPPPLPITMTILGVNQNDFFLNRPIHGTGNTSNFIWNGEFPEGYHFEPKGKFSPPEHPANDDEFALKLTLNNTSTTPRPVDIEITLNGKTMIQTPSPITIPASTTRHTLDLVPFTQSIPLQASPSRTLKSGQQKMWISLKSNGVLLDWIPINIETGPSVPQNLKAESDPNGVRLTWDPIPEAFTSDIEYEIFQGILDRGRNNVSSFLVRGGSTSTSYRVRARDLSTGRAGPFTDPVTSQTEAKAYQLSEGPNIEEGDHITGSQATAHSGPNLQTVTWTAPPAQLDPGEEFTIELAGSSSGPASFKYAPSGPFGSFSTPRGLSPGWISAGAIVNPTGPTRDGFADGTARAGYFRVSLEECPPDPQTRQFCYEPLAESFTQTLKAPVDRQEFWVVVRLGGFDSETGLLGGLVSWKYTSKN